jgi:hypothetical protein
MEMFVAPVTDQLSVLLAPEMIVVGLAVKELTTGAEPVAEDEPEGIVEPQPSAPMQVGMTKTSEHRSSARRITAN